ncbi:hypothetical protein ACS0TY_030331 [Phlomoides rotata]
MASASATFLCFGTSTRLPVRINSQMMMSSRLVSKGWGRTGGFRTSRFQIRAAKQETVEKVYEIVRKQLALSDDKVLTPQTTFVELGADSLDTVEIVMGLEEEFDISVQEENQDNITCIQEAADLIDQLVTKTS